MRLLYTTPNFWPYVLRGSERIVHDLAVEMTAAGHDVTVVTRTPGARRLVSRDEGFEVRYLPTATGPMGLDGMERFAVTAGLAAARQPADLYHAFYLTDAYGLDWAMRLRRRPYLFSWHGIPSAEWWRREHPRTHRWLLRVLERAAAVTVMTEVSAQRMREDYGYEPRVLAPGIFVDDYSGPRVAGQFRTVVCSAALDDDRKEHHVLLEAFSRISRDHPDLRLLLVGPGSPAAVLTRLDQLEPEVRGRVSVSGAVKDVAPLYAACTVGALTSRMEAFGLVVAEYLAAGMPAVVSDDGGSPEIISKGTGLTFAQGDSADCARALEAALLLAADPETEARCRARARDFDWSVRVKSYVDLYASIQN